MINGHVFYRHSQSRCAYLGHNRFVALAHSGDTKIHGHGLSTRHHHLRSLEGLTAAGALHETGDADTVVVPVHLLPLQVFSVVVIKHFEDFAEQGRVVAAVVNNRGRVRAGEANPVRHLRGLDEILAP